jgi:hypothetical protein
MLYGAHALMGNTDTDNPHYAELLIYIIASLQLGSPGTTVE